MKILFIGGAFDENGGHPSGVFRHVIEHTTRNKTFRDAESEVINGGNIDILKYYLETAGNYDIIFWFADVPNEFEKNRNIKDYAPKAMLITSKRNDNNKYSVQDMVQRALAMKANLFFEFSKQENGMFHIRVMDPLGCEWYSGTDIAEATECTVNRIMYLKSITRQSTELSGIDKDIVIQTYIGKDKEQQFINLVHKYSEDFTRLIDPGTEVKRFLGNCSLKPVSRFRCTKGMPSFRTEDFIFVSQRNIDKANINIENFVPVWLDDHNVLRYLGNHKPSVDTPIQVRLYKALPNINYMLHAHVYIKDRPITNQMIPCGGLEEVDEVLSYIDKYYGSRELTKYEINLKGHGSILMSTDVDGMKNIEYVSRNIPEKMY